MEGGGGGMKGEKEKGKGRKEKGRRREGEEGKKVDTCVQWNVGENCS